MYRVPPTRPWWPAVGAQLERGVRQHCARRAPTLGLPRPCYSWRLAAGASRSAPTSVGRHGFKPLHQRTEARRPSAGPSGPRNRLKTGASDEERTVGLAGRFQVILVEAQPKRRSRVARIPADEAQWTVNSAAGGYAALVAVWLTPKALTLLVHRTALFVLPNVRAKRAPAAGRQALGGENVQRTTDQGLVACRWRSA